MKDLVDMVADDGKGKGKKGKKTLNGPVPLTKDLVIMDNTILQILSIINFIFLFYNYRKFDFDDIVNKRISIITGTTALLFIYLILSVLFSYLPLLHTNIITLIPE